LRTAYRVLESLGEHEVTVTKDVSENGIRLPLADEVLPGTRLELAVTVPGEQEPIHAIGRIVWVRLDKRTRLYDTGIHLVHIKQVDRERLYRFALL